MPQLVNWLQTRARGQPEAPAFVYDPGAGAVEVSYADLVGQVQAGAGMLRELGCRPGDRVALFAANSPQWCAGYLAIHWAGMTVVPLDAGFTEREASNICALVEPAAALCDADHEGLLPRRVRRRMRVDEWSFDCEAAAVEPARLAAGQPLSIIFTSGTTGEPKGVMLSEDNICSNVRVCMEGGYLRPDDRVLLMLPLHHVYACTVVFLSTVCHGGCLVLPLSLKGEDLAGAVQDHGVTVFPTVPQVLGLLRKKIYSGIEAASRAQRLALSVLAGLNRGLRLLGLNASHVLLRSVHASFPRLRLFACGGARLEPDVLKDLRRLGFTVIEAYGLTETSPLVTMNSVRKQVPGSVGEAIPGVEIRLDRSDPVIEAGEVCVRGPNVMTGYYRNPQATAHAIQDGWFHTGDLGVVDRKGNLFLTGRAKELIVLPSGKNIYPEELEKHYAQSEAIDEVCVLSLPGREGGQENLTAVVHPNMAYFRRYKAGNLLQDVKYVIEDSARQLPSYQRVTRVELAPEPLPRTRLGKLKRHQVRQGLDERLSGSPRPGEAKEPETTDDPLLQFVMDALELSSPPAARSNLETDLGLDSLSKLELLAAFEGRFGVKISDDDATGIMMIEDLRPLMGEGGDAGPGAASAPFLALDQDPEPPLHEHVDVGEAPWGAALRLGSYGLARLMLRELFRLRVEGLEHLPASGPFIVGPNHTSYADAIVMHAALPYGVSRRMFSLSLPQIFGSFPLSLIRRSARVILTGTHDTTSRSMQYCAKVLQAGFPLCIFPEGKRSADGTVDAPKRGVGMLAHMHRAPIVPVYIVGANDLLSRSNPGVCLTTIRVQFLPAIDPSQPAEGILEEWIELMRRCEREGVRG